MDRPTGQVQRRAWVAPVLLAGFFVSGASGLGLEVVWARYFTRFIGGSTYAHTIVLATFMGGLALGNQVFGRLADRTRRRLLLYGVLELGIGLYGLVFPNLFEGMAGLYLAAAGDFGSAINMPLKLLLCLAAILPPTVLMGGTLPVLSRFVVREMGEMGQRVGQLYFINTGGAVVGTFACGFWFLPFLGVSTTNWVFAGANLALGALFLTLGALVGDEAGAPRRKRVAASSTPVVYTREQVRWTLVAIAFSGFASMTYELVWIRLLSLVMGSSVYSFTLMLTTFIGGIAFGGLVAGRMMAADAARPVDPFRGLAWTQVGVAISVVLILPIYERLPFAFHVLATFFPREAHAFPLYLGAKVLVAVALMFLPTLFVGMTLPFASRVATSAADRVGTGVGNAFSADTAGTLAGASAAGLLLIPVLGLHGALNTALAVNTVLGLVLLGMAPGRSRPALIRAAGLLSFAGLLYLVAFPTWNEGVLHSGLFRRKELVATDFDALAEAQATLEPVFVEDGPNTSVAVLRHRETRDLYLKVNGKTDAGTGNDMTTQLWLGHLPMLLAESPKDVLVIGLGSGMTAGAVLRHPIERLDQVELSSAVIGASRLFADYNGRIEEDPRYHLHEGDAKEFFKLQPDARYDAIISEPSNSVTS